MELVFVSVKGLVHPKIKILSLITHPRASVRTNEIHSSYSRANEVHSCFSACTVWTSL